MAPETRIQDHVAGKIKEWRRHRKMTQRDLAQALGMSQSAIAKIENGERNPDFSTVAQIAQILEIPWRELQVQQSSVTEQVAEFLDVFINSANNWLNYHDKAWDNFTSTRDTVSKLVDALEADDRLQWDLAIGVPAKDFDSHVAKFPASITTITELIGDTRDLVNERRTSFTESVHQLSEMRSLLAAPGGVEHGDES